MVQAVDLGAGGDDYFLVLGQFGHDDVWVPLRRHTVDFRDLSIGGGRIHGDGVDTSSLYFYVAVEHAAEYVAAVAVVHPAREGAAKDRSSAAVFHNTLEDAVHDGVAVCHFFLKAAVLYGSFVCHAARKGAVLDGVAVCHFSIEGAFLDVAAVFYIALEGSVRDFSSGVVCHCSIKDAAANCRIRFNRTLHSRIGPCYLGSGIGEIEIKRFTSTHQIQCAGVCRTRRLFDVLPAGATARDGAAVGSLRITILHDEVGAGDCSVQHHGLARHGEGHGVLVAVDVVALAEELAVQAENLGVGSDGHGGACADVRGPIHRHIVDFLDLGIGVGRIPGDGVDVG